jgi:hypothetical protein
MTDVAPMTEAREMIARYGDAVANVARDSAEAARMGPRLRELCAHLGRESSEVVRVAYRTTTTRCACIEGSAILHGPTPWDAIDPGWHERTAAALRAYAKAVAELADAVEAEVKPRADA